MMPCIWTRCPGPPAEKQAHNIKDPAVYLTVDMGYFFIPVCTKLIWWGCCQKAIFSVSSDNRSQCHLNSSRVWQLNLLEFVFGWVRRIFLETLPNNMWWFNGCLMFIFLGFWPQDSTNLCNSPAVIVGESLATQTLLLSMHYRHTSSFRQIFNIFSWLEPLNYYPDGGNGDFQCFNSFLTATFYFGMPNNLVLHIRNIFFVFFSLWWMIKGIWPLCSSYL